LTIKIILTGSICSIHHFCQDGNVKARQQKAQMMR